MSPSSRRTERGSAVVDFVLIMVLLVPLVLAIMQVALVMFVRNTVTLAASEGARHAAAWGSTPQEGLDRARNQWGAAISSRFVTGSRIETLDVDGVAVHRVVVEVKVPALGLGGPTVEFETSGSALVEPDPVGAS